MVAEQGHHAAPLREGDQLFHDTATVGAAVDEVTERDDQVVRAGIDRVDQRPQRRRAAVDIADGDDAVILHLFGSRIQWPPPVPEALSKNPYFASRPSASQVVRSSERRSCANRCQDVC